ncbi:flagellar biosynthesis anti-sigma factor FlgM [Sphingorhabdus sp.]|jgi:flagellar biosynthesis anti-sigma factor FlgM|uniref:flagellar biosynthesis anti-sigma factor FlgM n=1 Tax=Sphingorhabdus sp. TaxID=1902408 RepID=UPI00333F3451
MVHSVTSKPPVLVAVTSKVAPDSAAMRSTAAQIPQPTAQHISLASALAQKGPPFDPARIASLKEAIASGSYRIDLGAIADGVIRFGSHNAS